MNKKLLIDGLAWGAGLWLFGYILGFAAFFVFPKDVIGWVVMPFGIAATLWVLFKFIKGEDLKYYVLIGIAWAFLAIVLDYFFLVRLLNATNYYKLDVYIYYLLAFLLPVGFGWYKLNQKK